MKASTKIILALLVVAGAVGIYALRAGKKQEPEIVNMPNPVKAVDSAEEFKGIGLQLPVPVKAQETRFSIIAGNLAEIDCTIDGEQFTFRAQKEADVQSLSGIYGQWKESASENGVTYYTVEGDPVYYISSWQKDGVTYCISTDASLENLKKVTEEYR